ncbi:MAG: hypothetical protein JJ992_10850, partial [Planctomycetes bacterium]|nr:hypothetical protein [Planctomycetota bacterium]
MGELLLRADPQQPLPPPTRWRVLRTILNDPPLLIFAALHHPGDTVEPHQLVDWLASRMSHRLVEGEAYLGEPSVTPAIAKQWNRLRDHFRTLPRQQWIDQAA